MILPLVVLALLGNGQIAGTVEFKGRAPKLEKIKIADPGCGVAAADNPAVRLSADGHAVAEVLVRIVEPKLHGAPPAEPVAIEQKGCLYHPFVQGAVKGQKIVFKNSDGSMHNVHGLAGTAKDAVTLFNVAQPPGSKPFEKDPRAVDVVHLKCDVHPWMHAFVVVSEHPYFAVSGDDGRFEIKDVPPGHYTVEAWSDRLGTVSGEVSVEDGKAAELKLAFTGK